MTDEQKAIDKMTVKELREVSKKYDIIGASGLKKDELLEKIQEAQGGTVDMGVVVTPKPVAKKSKPMQRAPVTSVKECKKLISQFRKEKNEVKSSGDKKAVSLLRRKINQLKKKSRKLKKAV